MAMRNPKLWNRICFQSFWPSVRNFPVPFRFQHSKYLASVSSRSSSAISGIELDPGNLALTIFWDKQKSQASRFHTEWLRFNCQCQLCRQPSSNQRILECTDFPAKPTVIKATVQDHKLIIHWLEDDHIGFIDVSWLRNVEKYAEEKPLAYQRKNLPYFDFTSLVTSTENVLLLYNSILEDGFGIVYNLPTASGTVKHFVESIFRLPVQRTIYGETFDVISTPNPINVAYSNAELKPHIDLVYYESPPGLQLLHCLRFDDSVKGGESTLVDGFVVAEEMRKLFPAQFETLLTIPATFEKIHFDRVWPIFMRYRRPHVVLNQDRQITGIFWAPQFEGPLLAPMESTSEYYDAYRKFNMLIDTCPFKIQFRLKPGEMVVFNNRRLLHGRNAFSVGEGIRHFQGCYVHIDEFKSQAQVAFMKSGKSVNVPRVGNQSAF